MISNFNIGGSLLLEASFFSLSLWILIASYLSCLLAMLTMEIPQPMLQHQPTRQRGTVIIWARHIIRFIKAQQNLKKKLGQAKSYLFWPVKRIWLLMPSWTSNSFLRGTSATSQHQKTRHKCTLSWSQDVCNMVKVMREVFKNKKKIVGFSINELLTLTFFWNLP